MKNKEEYLKLTSMCVPKVDQTLTIINIIDSYRDKRYFLHLRFLLLEMLKRLKSQHIYSTLQRKFVTFKCYVMSVAKKS